MTKIQVFCFPTKKSADYFMLTRNINKKRKGIIKQLAQRKPEPKVNGHLGMLCERFRHVM